MYGIDQLGLGLETFLVGMSSDVVGMSGRDWKSPNLGPITLKLHHFTQLDESYRMV